MKAKAKATAAADETFPHDAIKPSEAAQLLRLHVSAVYRMMTAGKLSWWKMPSGQRRLSRGEVLAMPKPGNIVVQPDFKRFATMNREAEEVLRRHGL